MVRSEGVLIFADFKGFRWRTMSFGAFLCARVPCGPAPASCLHVSLSAEADHMSRGDEWEVWDPFGTADHLTVKQR